MSIATTYQDSKSGQNHVELVVLKSTPIYIDTHYDVRGRWWYVTVVMMCSSKRNIVR